MSPAIALLVWFILLVALFRFDPAKGLKPSSALWVPLIWMFIVGTRLPAQWLSGQLGQASQALEEGNPLDRTVNMTLILLAIGIVLSRPVKWAGFFARNAPLIAFLSFALVSVCWSDFPSVALKRWFKDLGNYLVILVVLSDRQPLEATRTLLRRLCYLLIPLSIVLIKYFPDISRSYDSWTGSVQIVGPATGKNLLGVIALLSGLFFFWDTVARWSTRKERHARSIIVVNGAFMAMTIWVLNLASSRTAQVCLALGCLVIIAAHGKTFQHHPRFLQLMIPAGFCLYLILTLGFGMGGDLAEAVGKDPTLTDRTKIWAFVLSMQTDPILGTGYESFWLGPRLQSFWGGAGLGRINEAHNGYLEVYLQLGALGLVFLSGLLIASYGTIWRRMKPLSGIASLSLAVWIVLLFYSWTEAGFRSNLIWLTFLLISITVPDRTPIRATTAPHFTTGIA